MSNSQEQHSKKVILIDVDMKDVNLVSSSGILQTDDNDDRNLLPVDPPPTDNRPTYPYKN